MATCSGVSQGDLAKTGAQVTLFLKHSNIKVFYTLAIQQAGGGGGTQLNAEQ